MSIVVNAMDRGWRPSYSPLYLILMMSIADNSFFKLLLHGRTIHFDHKALPLTMMPKEQGGLSNAGDES